MKKWIALLSITLCFQFLSAHPGIGIVKDRKGNIYYTDLKQIWKIDNNGKKTMAVPNVHSHELYMDSADNLYGEHVWYNGERLNTWGHYVWCLKNDGELVKIKEPSPGFLENYSFVRDQQGNMYWAERFKISRIKKKTPAGNIVTLVEGKFKDIRWMHATLLGELYFVDLNDLYKVDKQGKLTLVAKSLEERNTIFEYTSLKHNIFGIWLDKNDNIFIAVKGGGVVKKITAGTVFTFVHSYGGWSPTGGLFDDEGNLWLMETNLANDTRVRKITEKELSSKYSHNESAFMYAIPIIAGAGISILLVLVIKRFLFARNKGLT